MTCKLMSFLLLGNIWRHRFSHGTIWCFWCKRGCFCCKRGCFCCRTGYELGERSCRIYKWNFHKSNCLFCVLFYSFMIACESDMKTVLCFSWIIFMDHLFPQYEKMFLFVSSPNNQVTIDSKITVFCLLKIEIKIEPLILQSNIFSIWLFQSFPDSSNMEQKVTYFFK